MTPLPRCAESNGLHRCDLYANHDGYHAAKVSERWVEWFSVDHRKPVRGGTS